MITNPFALAAILIALAFVMFIFWGIGDYYHQQDKERRERWRRRTDDDA